jgi:hypothetical protein
MIMGPDRQLLADGAYFMVLEGEAMAAGADAPLSTAAGA